jgi:hypothetical protein
MEDRHGKLPRQPESERRDEARAHGAREVRHERRFSGNKPRFDAKSSAESGVLRELDEHMRPLD